MSGAGVIPPFQDLTPENQGPVVVVTAYVFVVMSILFSTIRVVNTFTLKRGFGLDDAYLVAATVLGLVQTILVEREADAGLGRYMAALTMGQIDAYYRFNYASQLLSILVMACAKMSVVRLVIRLSQQRSPIRRIGHAISLAVALWTGFSLLGLALECKLPQPWVYSPQRCAGQGAIWYPVIVLNLVTDLVIAFFFAPVLWKLNMRRATQSTVIFLFGLRVLVCCAAMVQLAVLAPTLHASDQTRSVVTFATVNQVVMNLSIMTASAPSIHRFLADLQTGSNGTRIPENTYGLSGYGDYKLSKPGSKSHGSNPRFAPHDGSHLSSHIFADHTSSSKGKSSREKIKENRVDEENSQSSLTGQGVLQTWEISMEAETGSKTDHMDWDFPEPPNERRRQTP